MYETILYGWHEGAAVKDKCVHAFGYKQYISDLKLYKHTAFCNSKVSNYIEIDVVHHPR